MTLYGRNNTEWIQRVVNQLSFDKAKISNYIVVLCVLNHQYFRARNTSVSAVKVPSEV